MKLLVAAIAVFTLQAQAQNPDVIWHNGKLLTMDDKKPEAQALSMKDGKIVMVGSNSDVLKSKGSGTKVIDLQGKTMIPGFVDAHSHISMVGVQAISANLLPPPDANNSSVADVQQTLRNFMKTSPTIKEFGVVMGFGYDDAQLKEQRSPTRKELDAISTTIPIVIVHQSGHLGVLNSKALELAGYSDTTKNPPGGVIQREVGSQKPNGVLEENAFFLALEKITPRFNEAQNLEIFEAGQQKYLSYGYTTVQDGRTSPAQVKSMIQLAQKNKLQVDIVSYPDVLMKGTEELMKAPYYHNVEQPPSYTHRFRIGGVKLTLDGSPQGKTAWLTKPYYKVPAGQPKTYAGYGVVPDDKVTAVYTQALQNRWQILTHANGDRAIDQMISSFKKAVAKFPWVDVRPVLIHGQTLRKDQIAELKTLHILPSLFPMHTFYWGDWHRESVLGPERAENISPTGWVLNAGLNLTIHSDAPVVWPDSMRVLSSAVTRKTRSGYVLGPSQRLTPLNALKAMTLWSAFQYWEEKSKGSLEVGKLADLAILSDNPLTVPEDNIINIKVLETIKEGKTIFKAEEQKKLARDQR